MSSRKTITIRKSVAYNTLFSLGIFLPLMGDALRPVPVPVVPPATKAQMVQLNPDDWQSLASAVRRQARHFGGASGYVIKDFKTGHVVISNQDTVFPSASLIKFPILCAAFQAAQEGKFYLNTAITMRHADKRGGSGILKMAPDGTV